MNLTPVIHRRDRKARRDLLSINNLADFFLLTPNLLRGLSDLCGSPCLPAQFQAIVRAEGHAPAAVDAHKGFPCGIQVYRIHGTRFVTLSAPDAQFLLNDDAAALSLGVGAGRACLSTGGWIASQACVGFKACGKATRRPDPDARPVPREILVHESRAGQ